MAGPSSCTTMKEYKTHEGWKRACKSLYDKVLSGSEACFFWQVTGLTKQDLRDFQISAIAFDEVEHPLHAGFCTIAEWDGEKGVIYDNAKECLERVRRIGEYLLPTTKTVEQSQQYMLDIGLVRPVLDPPTSDPTQAIFGFGALRGKAVTGPGKLDIVSIMKNAAASKGRRAHEAFNEKLDSLPTADQAGMEEIKKAPKKRAYNKAPWVKAGLRWAYEGGGQRVISESFHLIVVDVLKGREMRMYSENSFSIGYCEAGEWHEVGTLKRF